MDIAEFWSLQAENKSSLTQLERYEQKNAPEYIKKFIRLGGGAKMGTVLENFARFRFKSLQKRQKGKEQTGYDHLLSTDNAQSIYVEQKSSGHWGGKVGYKWQHIEVKHKWDVLLLCGIDYEDIVFWVLDRPTLMRLIAEKKVTNQGNKTGESSEGLWFNYEDVKDALIEIKTDADLRVQAQQTQAERVQAERVQAERVQVLAQQTQAAQQALLV
jgi:hypothetical protein